MKHWLGTKLFGFALAGCFTFLSISLGAFTEIEFRVNLRGYHPDYVKKALILSKTQIPDLTVELYSSEGNTRAEFKATPFDKAWEPFPFTYVVDFTSVRKKGTYRLHLKGTNIESHDFVLGPFPDYQDDVVDFIRSQRCGFNPYIHEFCHQKDGLSFYGLRPDSTRIDATGGWHDAGDQLKYLITGSNTVARLLMAYQMNPQSFKDTYDARGLRGSNGVPDILDEAKWGLEWILKLHPAPDELYHQVADDRDHRGFKLPHEENADYGWGPGEFRPVYYANGKPQGLNKYKSQATGVANLAGRCAASLAMAFEIFINFDNHKTFAQTCLKAARELYTMGCKQEGYQQGNSYGAPYRYEENTWADDMEWAAAALYKVTKEKNFLKAARKYADLIGAWSWMERDTASHYEMYPYVNMGHYALWQVGNKSDRQKMVAFYKQNLDKIRSRAEENPYGVGHLFIWCSNNLAAAVATQAMLYQEMSGSDEYHDLMIDHTNWLLGLNPWNTSMITEIPENADCPLDVHMPFWRILNVPIKGSLVDGPIYASMRDKMIAIHLSEPDEYAHLQPDHIRYMDDWADYSTNEPTLDGSAELLMILTKLSLE